MTKPSKHFKFKLAGFIIEVYALHYRAYNICRDFLCEGEPDITIRIRQEDIDRESAVYEKDFGRDVPSDVLLEVLALFRILAERLIEQGFFLMHGAAIAVSNEGFIFSAKSGTGKTTHILRWKEHLPETEIINGDKPFIFAGETPLICGSPWAGKEGFCSDKTVPLRAIVFLERAEDNRIERISFSEAFLPLYQQVNRPKDPEKMKKTMSMLKSLDGKVEFYRFHVNNFKDDAFQTAYDILVGGMKG